MKNILILSLLLLLAGCKFDSPLTSSPTREIDRSLLGSWFSLADGKPLDVFKLSAEEYLVMDDGVPYVCSHSDLLDANFISCKQINNNSDYYGKYAYMAYRVENGELVLIKLSDSLNIPESATASEIRKLIEGAIKNKSALDTNPESMSRFRKKS